MSLWKISSLCVCANNLSVISQNCRKQIGVGLVARSLNHIRANQNEIHTSCRRLDLMEFFDNEKNWSEPEVCVGRSWKLEELRIKSNSDLHKLWYVLLKEKNMLLTMQHEYQRKSKDFPNPERLDKVEESMENLENVVRERNRAYFELETGETGERPKKFSTNCFGLKYQFKMREHLIEKKYNTKFLAEEKLHNHTTDHKYVRNFLRKLDEKKMLIERAKNRAQFNKACKLLRVFPQLDIEALKERYPNLDIEEVRRHYRSRGHQENLF